MPQVWQTTVLGLVALIASVSWAQAKNDWQSRHESCLNSLSGFAQDPSTVSQPDYPSDLGDVTLEYFASGCFGSCPAFTLRIRRDSAQFEGRDYVRAKGKRTAKVTQQGFEKLLHAWSDGQFFAMRDDYCSIQCPHGTSWAVTDIPESSITLGTSAFTKRVHECFATIDGKQETPKPPEVLRAIA